MNKRYIFIAIALLLVVLLSACGSPNPMTGIPLEETGKVYGFWNGLWDGFTAIFAFIGNLFGGNYGIYEVHNNGGWYNFGFLLGIGALSSGGSSVSSSRRR